MILGKQYLIRKIHFMASYKQPTFQERAAVAAKAKQAALEKLRAKPPVDEATLAKRREAAMVRDAAKLKASQEKLAARELEKAMKKDRSTKDVVVAKAAAPTMSDEEQKAIRDAKYAARKNRLGKR